MVVVAVVAVAVAVVVVYGIQISSKLSRLCTMPRTNISNSDFYATQHPNLVFIHKTQNPDSMQLPEILNCMLSAALDS
jgi:hypothetical protein